MLGYELLLFVIKIETSTRGTNSMPFLPFRRGSFNPHRESFSVRGHLRSNLGIISGLGIICGAVWRREMFGSWGQFLEGHEKFFPPWKPYQNLKPFLSARRVSNLRITGLFCSNFSRKQRLSITSYKNFQTCTALCFYTQINWKMAGISLQVVIQKAGQLPLRRGDEWAGIDRWTLSVLLVWQNRYKRDRKLYS